MILILVGLCLGIALAHGAILLGEQLRNIDIPQGTRAELLQYARYGRVEQCKSCGKYYIVVPKSRPTIKSRKPVLGYGGTPKLMPAFQLA